VRQGELLLLLLLHLVLTALPGAAACLFTARAGVGKVPVLLAVALAGSAAAGLLGFWSFYASPLVGETFSFLVFGGSALAIGFVLWDGDLDRGLLRSLATPALLWALGSAFLLMLGFVHGGTDSPLATSANRFSHPLPGDNVLPSYYADWFFQHGHNGPPPLSATWHFSDRPPLQVGFDLLQRPLGWDVKGLNYQVMGVVLQQLWIVGLWALLLAARVGRLTRALAMSAVLLSDLAMVNGFYVWPKMLPTALLLAAAALVLTPLWPTLRRSLWAAALVAALLALALLGHGSAVFGAIPLAAVALWRGVPGRRWFAVALAVGAVLMVPWAAYQHWGDPPGDRLTKWTLAGVIGPNDHRGVVEAVLDSYGEAGLDRTIERKVANFTEMAAVEPTRRDFEAAAEAGSLTSFVRTIRGVSFFYLLPSLWLLLLAPLVVAVGWGRRRRRPAEWSFALSCLKVFAIGIVAWGLISFGNLAARTVIHVGSFLLPLLAICGAVVAMRAVFPRFAIWLVGANALLGLAVYAPALDPPLGTSYQPLAILLSLAGLLGFVFLALRGTATPSPATVRAGTPQPLAPGSVAVGSDPGAG
jgi:hypothetical protein